MASHALPPERIDAGLVVLRRHRVEDAEAVAQAVRESLDHLQPWMPWATDEAGTADNQRERIAGDQAWDEGTECSYVILTADEQEIVGGCGLMRRIGEGGIEIGYWTHARYGGLGFGAAAARALTEAALALPDVERIEIHCDEANRRSRAIPERLGYRLARVEEDKIEAPGESGRSMIWVLEKS